MTLRCFRALLTVVALLLAASCAEGVESAGRSDAPTVSTTPEDAVSAPDVSASSKPSSTKLVVLGDSNAHPTSCYDCVIFPDQVARSMSDKLGSEVEVVNLAWALSNPKAAEVRDILEYVRTDTAARDELQEAEAVIILVSDPRVHGCGARRVRT